MGLSRGGGSSEMEVMQYLPVTILFFNTIYGYIGCHSFI